LGPTGPTGAPGTGSGTVSSVALTAPAIFTVSGSPITASGTLALTYSGTALPVANGGTGVTTSTGTGNTVLSTSPSLTTPTQTSYESWTGVSAPSYTEGRLWYDSAAHALAYFNDSSSAIVHIGQDIQVKVINNTGSTIANGAPVYITSTSSGQTYPNIALAKADVAATSAVIGLTNGSIANGAIGYVTAQGGIDNVNTGTFTVGQVLYLSPYSAGQLMNTIPPTGIAVQVGTVSYVDASVGKIFVKQTTPLSVSASVITGAVAIANGGTGQTTQAAAITALTGTQTAGRYLRSDGTNAALAAIQAADVPTLNQNTTGTAANITGTTNSTITTLSALSLPGSQVSGNISGNAANVTGTVAIANGGTGLTTTPANGALDIGNGTGFTRTTLTAGSGVTITNSSGGITIAATGSGGTVTSVTGTSPVVSSGGTTPAISLAASYGDTQNPYASKTANYILAAPNGSAGVPTFRAIVAADVPTLNQNTTGTAANVTGTVAIANGGTGLTSFTANYIHYGSFTTSANLQFDGTTMRVGSNALLGGTTNPIVGVTGAINNYIQSYIYNATNGISASADFVAYANNSTDAHGWADMGFTSSTYADITYTVTGPNEAYLFGSALNSSYTGNLVYATDNTGSANAHQWYVGGFTQSKGAYKMQLSATQLITTVNLYPQGTNAVFGATFLDSNETVNVVAAAPSATTNYYVQSGSVQYYTTNAANNWTLNISFSSLTSMNTVLAIGQSVTCVLITTQGATAYYNSAVTIDGTAVTPKWIGGAPTVGNASGLDVYRYAIVKTASATYTVLASLTQYK
jgi:hypothetical protein